MGNSNHEDPSKLTREFGHVASGVGHHVINGFAAIVSNAEIFRVALTSRSSMDREAIATTIIRAALDASVVARRMIDYSRQYTSPNDADVVLSDLVRDYVARRQAEGLRGVSWLAEVQEVPAIHGNPDHLVEMLDRLTDNALDSALPDHSPLQITLGVSLDNRGWVQLEVADTGCGMEHNSLERAVEPFFSTKPGRLGVGLTIANGIWRRHRGTLSIRSQPGAGTTIRLCIDPTSGSLLSVHQRERTPIVQAATSPLPTPN